MDSPLSHNQNDDTEDAMTVEKNIDILETPIASLEESEEISTFDSVEASEMAVVNCRDKPKKKKKGHEENREKEVVTTYGYMVIKTEEDYISTITEMSTEEVIM